MPITEPHEFNPDILREYDIRGVVGETLTVEDAKALGLCLGTMLKRVAENPGRKVTACVARDGRVSSVELQDALIDGFISTGADVINVGLGPTPMLYYAAHHFKADVSVMVTGSHNPPSHNGFKIMKGKKAFFGEDIQNLGRFALRGDFSSGKGELREEDVQEKYIARILRDFETDGPNLKIAWDPGNGAVGDVLKKLCAEIPAEHILLNAEIDGTFPNHHPDPTVAENMQQLRQTVLEQGCDLGIGFDGDGDRIGVIDDKGNLLFGDQLLVLWAEEVLEKFPSAKIIADAKASQVLFDEIERLGGKPIMAATGHSLIKAKIAETSALLAGEMSGHIFFADKYYGFDDALYAAVRLLSWLYNHKQTLSERLAELPKLVNTPEVRLACPDNRKFTVIEEVKARLTAVGQEYSDVDGVRVNTDTGWWLLRASNTQPALSMRVEATDESALSRLADDLRFQLEESGVEVPGGLALAS
jgi:phosphomannomutase